MQFQDVVLVRLADPGSRAGVFDQDALAQIISASYDTSALNLQGPFSPVFDDLQIGFATPRLAQIAGSWAGLSGADPTQARFQLMGLGGAGDFAEAWWRGGIVGRVALPNAPVAAVDTTFPSLGTIDDLIVADLGALPVNPADLEQARRARLRALLQAAFFDPNIYGDQALDAWLAQTGAADVSDLLARFQGSVQPGGVSVTFAAPPAAAQATPQLFPLSAAVLIRDSTLSLGQTLLISRSLVEQVRTAGLEVAPAPGLRLRRSLAVIWIVPGELFDDDDWPGAAPGMNPVAQRAARRARAGQWLAQEGIGLAVV